MTAPADARKHLAMPAPLIWLLAAVVGLVVGVVVGAMIARRQRALGRREARAQAKAQAAQADIAFAEIQAQHAEAIAQRDAARDAAKRRAKALESLVLEIDQLAYAASHDLRAPLQNIERLVGFLREDLAEVKLSDEAEQNLDLIDGRVKRMNALLTSVAEFARAGRGIEEPDECSVPELVAEVGEQLKLGDRFSLRYEGEPAVFDTADEPLAAVLTHLVDNAVQHHDKDGGTIVVRSELADEGLVRLSVIDDGPGIPASQHARIFEMFRTLERRDVKEAVGMGLPIVRRVVESLGGRMTVDSPLAGDRGTAMRFTWPLEWPQTGTVVQAFGTRRESRMLR